MPKGTEMFRQSKEASTIFWPAKKVKYVSNTIQNQILDPRNKISTEMRKDLGRANFFENLA